MSEALWTDTAAITVIRLNLNSCFLTGFFPLLLLLRHSSRAHLNAASKSLLTLCSCVCVCVYKQSGLLVDAGTETRPCLHAR